MSDIEWDSIDSSREDSERLYTAAEVKAAEEAAYRRAADVERTLGMLPSAITHAILAPIEQPSALEEVKRLARREAMLEEHGNRCDCHYDQQAGNVFVPCERRVELEAELAALRAGRSK